MTRLRGLAALIALIAITVGVPLVLLALGNWPITGVPSVDQLRNFTDTAVSDTTVFAVLTVAAWLIWGSFTASVLVEFSSTFRGIQAPRLVFVGPLQRSARTLVAAVVLAATLRDGGPPVGALPLAASVVRDRPVSTFDLGVIIDPVGTMAGPDALSQSSNGAPVGDGLPLVQVTVGRNDNAWSVAEDHLGDGMRWREVWELNRGRVQSDGRTWVDPQVLRAGWTLDLPDLVPTHSTVRNSAATAPSASLAAGGTVRYKVERGDTLTDIAEEQLGDADRYREIYELNRNAEEPDGRHFTDPDLILPGWHLTLPADEPTQSVDTESAPPATSVGLDDALPPASSATSTFVASTATAIPIAVATDATSTATIIPQSGPPSTDATPVSSSAPAPAPINPSPDPSVGRDDAMPLSTPLLVGLASALVLATGLAARVRFLRRRNRRSNASAGSPPAARYVEAALIAASDMPLVRWAGQELSRLVQRLDRSQITGTPVAVELSEESGIELLWSWPQHDAPGRWRTADEGWAWRLDYDPDAPTPVDELPAALPALVTVGERDGRQLLIDLEAFGSIAVDGDPTRVCDFLRAVATELATSHELADAYVMTVAMGDNLSGIDRLNAGSADDAVRRMGAARSSVKAVLDLDRLESTFQARLGSSTPIEATVVIGLPSASSSCARLIDAAPAHCGVCLVVAGNDAIRAGGHVRIDDDGTATFVELDLTFTAVALPNTSVADVASLLDSLAVEDEDLDIDRWLDLVETTPDERRDEQTPVPALTLVPPLTESNTTNITEASFESEDLPTSAPQDDTGASMMVRVLGVPRVPDRPDLGRRELVLTSFLACRNGPVATSAVQDALWGGRAVDPKTIWNVVAATRRALGELPDGTSVMPPADRTRSTLQLATSVTTDLAVLRDFVDRARDEPSTIAVALLTEALALVDGPPFDAVGYDWAHRDQLVAEASALIEIGACHLVELSLASGDAVSARDAVLRGLKGLPGNEQLYRCRMRVEHHVGNLAGVTAAYEELIMYLADLEGEPSPATAALYHDLVRPARK